VASVIAFTRNCMAADIAERGALDQDRTPVLGGHSVPVPKSAALAVGLCLYFLPSDVSCHEIKAGELVIVHPWTPEPPKGSATAAIYMTIKNTGSRPDRLLKVEAPVAASASLHESKDVGGIAKMKPRESMAIPANGELALKPLGLHVMLMGLNKQLTEFDQFPITLVFERAGKVEADVEVTAPRAIHAPHS
jgi:periplasmic copper chaperone A